MAGRSYRLGTRVTQSARCERLPQGSETRSVNGDVGLATLVTASLTFGSGQVSAANGTFTAFNGLGLPFPILVEGTNLNNGFFTVTGVDATNQSYLTLDPAPKTEGPLTATVRTP